MPLVLCGAYPVMSMDKRELLEKPKQLPAREHLEAHVSANKRKDFRHCPRRTRLGLVVSDSPLMKTESVIYK